MFSGKITFNIRGQILVSVCVCNVTFILPAKKRINTIHHRPELRTTLICYRIMCTHHCEHDYNNYDCYNRLSEHGGSAWDLLTRVRGLGVYSN